MGSVRFSAKDSLGVKYGKLTVLELLPPVKNKSMCQCVCECGRKTKVRVNNLRSGMTQTCGHCRRSNKPRMKDFASYGVWRNMIKRCRDEGSSGYESYGGRGIKVCERWRDFDAFLADMGDRPEGHTIERIDYNGDYCPDNCKWIKAAEQARNTRKNRWISFGGKTMLLCDWSNYFGITSALLHKWINKKGIDGAFDKATCRMSKTQ